MSNYNRRGLPKLPAYKRNIISVSEYLKVRDERANLPGRINKEGEMQVLYNGEWMGADKFAQQFPPIIVPDFTSNLLNVDRTNIWMHS